ncbi:hypothetical protein BDY21DRAFT_370403 [Lineolata rhizophorae]|uniref:Uncharacterized protein n=1 Tax=Lineolata rhizophorae TaxID=578093 RepID=A0A6A6P4Q5_9PEZI|nr:hypothetical protein BDY21DRAFT_370403 [Lineolata rhizophorae]
MASHRTEMQTPSGLHDSSPLPSKVFRRGLFTPHMASGSPVNVKPTPSPPHLRRLYHEIIHNVSETSEEQMSLIKQLASFIITLDETSKASHTATRAQLMHIHDLLKTLEIKFSNQLARMEQCEPASYHKVLQHLQEKHDTDVDQYSHLAELLMLCSQQPPAQDVENSQKASQSPTNGGSNAVDDRWNELFGRLETIDGKMERQNQDVDTKLDKMLELVQKTVADRDSQMDEALDLIQKNAELRAAETPSLGLKLENVFEQIGRTNARVSQLETELDETTRELRKQEESNADLHERIGYLEATLKKSASIQVEREPGFKEVNLGSHFSSDTTSDPNSSPGRAYEGEVVVYKNQRRAIAKEDAKLSEDQASSHGWEHRSINAGGIPAESASDYSDDPDVDVANEGATGTVVYRELAGAGRPWHSYLQNSRAPNAETDTLPKAPEQIKHSSVGHAKPLYITSALYQA